MVFFAPPNLTALDLIGPFQAFQVAERVAGHRYLLEVCGLAKSLAVGGNLQFTSLKPYRNIRLGPRDILCIAGFSGPIDHTLKLLRSYPELFAWIRRQWQGGATISSVCTGSYLLAEAGLLDGLACTTHWRDAEDMQRRYPRVEVRQACVFVEAGRIYTSAGVAAGIDLAIHLLGVRHGPRLAFEVARQLVVYLRRGGSFAQDSVYLQYRNHLDDTVHRAQDILVENLPHPPSLLRLAEQVGASARNLSRRFRQQTGLSVGEYHRELRLEHARVLLGEEGSKVEDVARACGFTGARQMRNIFRDRFGQAPRERFRQQQAGA